MSKCKHGKKLVDRCHKCESYWQNKFREKHRVLVAETKIPGIYAATTDKILVTQASDTEYKVSFEAETVDKCPECKARIRVKSLQEGGGVECSAECGWWECY